MSSSTDTASFTVNVSVPRETIREYFDGLAKVETAKRGSSIDWSALLSLASLAAPTLASLAAPALSSRANHYVAPVSNDYYEDSYDSDEPSDEEFYDNVPVQSSVSQCEVDISKSKVGDQVKTIVEFVSAHGGKGKEALDQLISALTFIRDNESEGADDEQAKLCCPGGVCVTGACEPSTKVKGKESSGETNILSEIFAEAQKRVSASTAEDSFSPDLSKKGKKTVKKPVYQEAESSGVSAATDLTSFVLSNMGLKIDGEQGTALKDFLGGLSAGLLGNLTAASTDTTGVKIPVPVAEKKPESTTKAAEKSDKSPVDEKKLEDKSESSGVDKAD